MKNGSLMKFESIFKFKPMFKQHVNLMIKLVPCYRLNLT